MESERDKELDRRDEHDECDDHDQLDQLDEPTARWLSDIFTRAESIALRTDCWLYIVMQESTSPDPPFHYTSPRLRRDVPDFLERTHKKVETTMAAATIVARLPPESQTQADILAYGIHQLKRAKRKTEDVERELESAQEEIAVLKAELAAQKY
ncbi:hypothetical protein DFP72DRAFT_851109 [Ephemerocybe angulata]|uniref:Uncharacterized protein n=1 Tax=Ephemerocybe angulata TaxID=980116 RepID=A0A8H6M0Q9_9AGAR|nr:hypothetical protein DFP72DRAFT_851109 [Tulosesus angulatus]